MTSPAATQPGRSAASPAEIPPRGWKQILGRVRREIGEDHVSVVAAGIAFYGLIALFPAIAALVGISGLFLDPSDLGGELSRLSSRLPPSAAEIIENQVVAVTGGSGTGSGLVALSGLAVAVYGAMKGVLTLIEGLNIAYDEEEKRGLVRLYLTALGLTLGIIFGLVATLGLAVVLPTLLKFLFLGARIEALLPWISWLVLGAFTMLGLALIYRFGPSREPPRWRWVSPGAAAATLVWVAGTAGFSVYVQNLGTYAETYGALGGVIVLLTWLWLSAFVILAGAELNAETEAQAAASEAPVSAVALADRDALLAENPKATPAEATRSRDTEPRILPLLMLAGLLIWHRARTSRDAPEGQAGEP